MQAELTVPRRRFRFAVILEGRRVAVYDNGRAAWGHARSIVGTVRREQYIEFLKVPVN